MKLFNRLTVIVCLLGWSFAAFGQTSEQPKSWLIYQDEISKLWKIQNEFLEHRNDLEGGQIFKQIMFLKESYELEQIPALSTTLLRKIPPLDSLNSKSQHPYYQMAVQLSPNHYTNDFYMCKFHADPVEWVMISRYCFEGLKKELSNPSERLILLSKLSYQVFWMIFALLVFYLALYIVKFLPFTVQYYSSAFYWISPISFLFLVSMIAILILFTFGWLFFLSFFYIFLWRFPSIKEKFMLFFLLCMTMCLPFTFAFPALNKQFHSGIYYDILHSASTLKPSKFEEKITRYADQNPKDAFAHFTLGTMAKKIGNLDMARLHFERSRSNDPDFFKTQINLANLMYEFGDSDGAKAAYKKLITEHPTELSSYINLSQIYTHESRYLDGEEFINQAKKIDENKFKRISKSLHNRQGTVRLIYEELTPQDLQEKIYAKGEAFKFQFQQFFSHYFPKYSMTLFYFTLIFSALFAVIFQLITHTRNYYFLYFNREKNLEKLTLIQLKDYPEIYRRFAANLALKENINRTISMLLPGYQSFLDEKLIKSFAISALFFFFTAGVFIDVSFPKINEGFPWTAINITFCVLIFLFNLIDVSIQYDKKKN